MKTYSEQYQEDLNKIFEKLLYRFFFNNCSMDKEYTKTELSNMPVLELYVTPECNQKCTYCYLCKHGDDLYPKEIRDKQQILSNLKSLLNFIIDKRLFFHRVDLFSGEIWGTEFGINVFDVILDALKRGLKIDAITIPSNCSFLLSENKTFLILDYINKFNYYGVILNFSASVDGQVIENKTRPFRSSTMDKPESFYDTLFKTVFSCDGWGFHPMIDSSSISDWKDNYLWWINKFQEYGKYNKDDWYNYLMTLEIRDERWDDKSIYDYLDWLNFKVDIDLKQLWSDNVTEFILESMFKVKFEIYTPTDVIKISNSFPCSAGNSLIIRLGDLAVVPCHRTSYPRLIYGKLIKDETGKITSCVGINPILMNSILGQGVSLMFKCSSCPLKLLCSKGCMGAQLEYSGEIYNPIPNVCYLNIAKYLFLFSKINKLMENLSEDDKHKIKKNESYTELEKACEKLINDEDLKEEIIKWQDSIKKILS